MKKVTIAIAVVLGLLSARPLKDINLIEGLEYEYDDFDDGSTITTSTFPLMVGSPIYTGNLHVSFRKRTFPKTWIIFEGNPKDSPYGPYTLEYSFVFGVWGFDDLHYFRSVSFLCDDSIRINESHESYSSYGCFILDSSDLAIISNANTVRVKIECSSRITGDMTTEARKYFKLFYEAIIERQWETMLPEQSETEEEQ